MREIKFRAWDAKNKIMRQAFWVGSITGKPHSVQNAYQTNEEDWKLMQYTGLKDKNGKEIYEGDTLKNPNDPRGNKLFDVAWSEMFHGWIGNSQTECLQMKPCVFDECEVIGNIHDTNLTNHKNPELLETERKETK